MGKPPSKAPIVTRNSFSISGGVFAGQLVGRMEATNRPTSWTIVGSASFAIDGNGVITVSEAGVGELNRQTQDVTYDLSVTAKNRWGTGTAVALVYREGYIFVPVISSATGRAQGMGAIYTITSGGGGIPPGVTFMDIDGGATYFATNGFTKTSSFPTSIAYTSGTVPYSAGWDSPNFIATGGFLNQGDTTMINMYKAVNWNTLHAHYSTSVFTQLTSAGISIVSNTDEFWSAQGGTLNGSLPTNSITTGPLPDCMVILGVADEPQYESVMKDPIGGTPTSANGTVPNNSGNTITAAFQSGRAWSSLFAFTILSISQSLSKSPSDSTQVFFPPFTTTYPMPSGGNRNPTDTLLADCYTMVLGRFAQFYGQTFANVADGSFSASAPWTMLETCRGSHQGVFIDYLRNWCTANLTAGYRRPLGIALSIGNIKGNIPYEIGLQEATWESWSALIHGARILPWFDHSDECGYFNHTRTGSFMEGGNQPPEGILGNSDTQLNQTVTFTGVISSGPPYTLTVTGITPASVVAASGLPGGMFLNSGMEITHINGVSQAPNCPVIQTQLTFDHEGDFTAQRTGFGTFGWTVVISSLTGVIPVPCKIIYPGTSPANVGPSNTDASIFRQVSGTVNGAGNYEINRGFANDGSPVSGCYCYCPGMNGTYAVSGGVAGSPVTMIAKQPDVRVLGNMTGTNNATGHIYGQIQAFSARVRDLAPILNSRFAIDFVKDVAHGSSNIRYIFPKPADGTSTCVPHGYGVPSGSDARAFILSTGIDCCVHYYEGPTYTSVISSESLTTNTFYIFATTAYPENTVKDTITCTFAVASGSSVTVIGESRTIPISGGTFSDTFQYAWTVHVYKVNP